MAVIDEYSRSLPAVAVGHLQEERWVQMEAIIRALLAVQEVVSRLCWGGWGVFKLNISLGGKGGSSTDASMACATANGKLHTFAGTISG